MGLSGPVVCRAGRFWLADKSPETQTLSPETVGGGAVRIVTVAQDPDAACAQAVAAGATVVWPVADQPSGWRVGRAADPFRRHREIGKPLPGGRLSR